MLAMTPARQGASAGRKIDLLCHAKLSISCDIQKIMLNFAPSFITRALMEFRTPVSLPDAPFRLLPSSHALTVGSCFAEGVGRRLIDSLAAHAAMCNPLGVMYNPASVATTIGLLLDTAEKRLSLREEDFILTTDGLWHHRLCAGEVAGRTMKECRETMEQRLRNGAKVLTHADILAVTFGTDRVYRYAADGAMRIAANCHKLPAAGFREEVLTPAETTGTWDALLGRLQTLLPQLHIVITVSPYRYLKYGLHENALSKARLLMAADDLCTRHAGVHYFPAYEIMTDELRDYRFYAADMVHPSPVAVEYVFHRFAEWCFSPELREMAADKAALLRDYAHRPLHPDTPSAKAFLKKREERRVSLEGKWGRPLVCTGNPPASIPSETA